jgi:hypothetical protein
LDLNHHPQGCKKRAGVAKVMNDKNMTELITKTVLMDTAREGNFFSAAKPWLSKPSPALKISVFFAFRPYFAFPQLFTEGI